MVVVIADDASFSVVTVKVNECQRWEEFELLKGPEYKRFVPDWMLVHLDFDGIGGLGISERLRTCEREEGFLDSPYDIYDDHNTQDPGLIHQERG